MRVVKIITKTITFLFNGRFFQVKLGQPVLGSPPPVQIITSGD